MSLLRTNSNRSVRSLLSLQSGASTARALNLTATWRKNQREPGYIESPFFRSPVLNRAIILKHRLRADEIELLGSYRTTATKVILPLDPSDLRVGARSFFIYQTGYRSLLEEVATGDLTADRRDETLLHILDGLPSLDPFLMRERLRQEEFNPDRCYFNLSEADSAQMFEFVRRELRPLVGMSFDDVDVRMFEKTDKLAQKIMANAADAELEPLRRGLNMEKAAFEEGIFCWKGFIYYKWTLNKLLPQVRPVSEEIASIKPSDKPTMEDKIYMDAAKERLEQSIDGAIVTVRNTLKVYDKAYRDLTHNGKPAAFREFLMKAPSLFYELGERLGSVDHIVSFWRYRFPAGARPKVSTEDLFDILADFEASLSFEPHHHFPR
ncbi:hypothetical protein [Phenylobacterium sp.]|jgi:hypothetical protein|uniref:hypothetical protein n=1 Tax=Phenylobacterium sp. TaxID=1871053 RepID=UPI0040363943